MVSLNRHPLGARHLVLQDRISLGPGPEIQCVGKAPEMDLLSAGITKHVPAHQLFMLVGTELMSLCFCGKYLLTELSPQPVFISLLLLFLGCWPQIPQSSFLSLLNRHLLPIQEESWPFEGDAGDVIYDCEHAQQISTTELHFQPSEETSLLVKLRAPFK